MSSETRDWVLVPSVDTLAQIIREVDGKHSLGAAALAEAIVANLPRSPAEAQVAGDKNLLADLETVWHSVSDDRETNAAYTRLSAALSAQPRPEVGWDTPCGACECGIYDAKALAAFDGTVPKCKRFDRHCVGAVHALVAQQPRPEATFAEWLATEMPAGTVIGDPAWWANRIARQYAVRSSRPDDVARLVESWIADGDTIPKAIIKATRDAIGMEFGHTGTAGYYKRILVKVFCALTAAQQEAPTDGR